MPIKKLSVQLANQIAAGEVVENPASVVKELLENAIDAHATAITLEVKEAGKLLIKVTDNGSGIPQEELPLALAPHATSKISELEDLDAIVTLGFRGEALASIAAVSKLSLVSNTIHQDHGYKVEVEGPEQNPYIYPAAHPVGTSVIVRELFFNTPARRRFLKSDRTELSKIRDIFTRIALVNYTCEFRFIVDGKMVLQLPATNRFGLPQRIAKLLGAEYKGPLIKLDNFDPNFQQHMVRLYEDEHFGLEGAGLRIPPVLGIHGVLVYPEVARKGIPDKLVFFLNGRCMGDKLVAKAIREGFAQALHSGTDYKPSVRGVLFLECDPHIVDVNVHPRKDEVRFHNSNVIFDCIVFTIKTALLLHGITARSIGQGFIFPEVSEPDFPSGKQGTGLSPQQPQLQPQLPPQPQASQPLPPQPEQQPELPPLPQQPQPASTPYDDAAAPMAGDSGSGREAELRASVEQFFAQHPTVLYHGQTVEQPTLQGACCDFGSLKAGLATLNSLRAAQQAVSSFYPQYAPQPLAADTASNEFDEQITGPETSAHSASESFGTNASASVSTSTSVSSGSGVNLEEMMLQQERSRQLERSGLTGAEQVASDIVASEVSAGVGADSVEDLENSSVSAGNTANTVAEPVGQPSEVPTPSSAYVPLSTGAGAVTRGPEPSAESDERARNIMDRSRSFAQAMQVLTGSRARYRAGNTAHNVMPTHAGVAVGAASAASASTSSFGSSSSQFTNQGISPFERPERTAVTPLGATPEGELADGLEGAQFLALIAPNVLLFCLQNRYFIGKGSDLLAECLALEYGLQVRDNTVRVSELKVPFALKVDSVLAKAFKQEEIRRAAARCGFRLQVSRGIIELQTIPEYLLGCNLAALATQALHLIAAGSKSINGGELDQSEAQAPQQLCTMLARAREYEINTEYDARYLLSGISSFEQLKPLLQHGTLQELNLLELARQLLRRS
ncbi:MAG TPA: DNA mismatch repair endonuclease MutL [Candidatus Anaerobiospirillum pullistercoris]|uniref:DNA mismatch repair protein MutL n=1 Tax=Candidatus Anaerobiospirillum pullistercoris TaxID=2838452 RepID=A0A9D2B040_9GAMM|nr:DNA mismatch repair endonuclease MutL [Candidatus Anaerobiospirillum pullistercoris]